MTKVAFIGAASFVFGPTMLSQIILDQRMDDVELALIDLDADVLELMAGVGRRMAQHSGAGVTITTHTDREAAFAGADFVICSAAVQMQKRFATDVGIIRQHMPNHLITEFGGISGIAYSLRQIALIDSITNDMRRLCPDAWLLNIANPLPRVCQYAEENDIRTVGFCSVALRVHDTIGRLLHGEPQDYPFTEARQRWQMTTAGTNHFTWVVELKDRATGADLLPELPRRIHQGHTSGNPQIEQICRDTGYLLACGDNHAQDFLTPYGVHTDVEETWHGSEDERRARINLLADIVAGRASWEPMLAHVAWERPADVIAALRGSEPVHFERLNLPNAGQMPDLQPGTFVETPCMVGAGRITPQPVTLPDSVLALSRRAVDVTDTIVRAAQQRSRALVHLAVELDPTVTDTQAGIAAIDDCLAAHADLLPDYQ